MKLANILNILKKYESVIKYIAKKIYEKERRFLKVKIDVITVISYSTRIRNLFLVKTA